MPISLDMLRLSNAANTPTIDGDDIPAEPDEPPDHRGLKVRPPLVTSHSVAFPSPTYSKTKTVSLEGKKKESLLTRALLSSPELLPVDPSTAKLPPITDLTGLTNSSALSNRSIPSSAELTSDSETTSPIRSNTPSTPPHHNQLPRIKRQEAIRTTPVNIGESELEANLGRKRCITFTCGRNLVGEGRKPSNETIKEAIKPELPKRKSALTFACPVRPSSTNGDEQKDTVAIRKLPSSSRTSRSPAPLALRKGNPASRVSLEQPKQQAKSAPEQIPIQLKGERGVLELSDAVRYHEFGSESDDDWVNEATDYKQKITLNDCMKKEIAIRKLGEEAEEEARQDEEDDNAEEDDEDEEGEDDDDEDEDEDEDENEDEDEDEDEDGDHGDDGSTVQDGGSDDGNESDNEAGFASSDETDDSGEYGFWTPKVASAVSGKPTKLRRSVDRRDSNTSIESHSQSVTPIARRSRKPSKPIKFPKFRPGTPTLPDSTDFVCGTLDEDRPLEAAYISCMEERRRSKHIPIPQDIDPSFPTSEPEEDEDDDLEEPSAANGRTQAKASEAFEVFNEECLRGRPKGITHRITPRNSPIRPQSPPPRRLFGRSPKQLKSPPPVARLRSPPPTRRTSVTQVPATSAYHVHFTGLAQRPNRTRTSSLPRTPNPFFARLAQPRQSSRASSTSPARPSRRRKKHTRGAIDIVAGLEQKRAKRREKFWRQHCRKAAKEQLERKRPLYGKGAERMRELGLEVAERFKAYNVITGAQLVLSV
ncbi:hypothetical protein PRK78_003753 [Emydomyces testavorans]|uniref:Uncharacterized protein n=1 Tax=Emydomyces testavorans TaxID=2070801 RepID=A0AAF0IHY6_9EURO|nr:hypothetical protein PRK78_003753 [Emydomyces testavorans]